MARCSEHDNLVRDATESKAISTQVSKRLDSVDEHVEAIRQKLERVARQLWIMVGAAGVVAALVTPAAKAFWEAMIPTARAQSHMDAVSESVATDSPGTLVGLAIIVLTVGARVLLHRRISIPAEQWVSTGALIAVVFGASLVSGADVILATVLATISAGASSRILIGIKARLRRLGLVGAALVAGGCGAGALPCDTVVPTMSRAVFATHTVLESHPEREQLQPVHEALESVASALEVAEALCRVSPSSLDDHTIAELLPVLEVVREQMDRLGIDPPPALDFALDVLGLILAMHGDKGGHHEKSGHRNGPVCSCHERRWVPAVSRP